MSVPGGARAGFECDMGTAYAGRVRRLKERIDADRSGEPLRRSFAGRLRATSLDLHNSTPWLCGLRRSLGAGGLSSGERSNCDAQVDEGASARYALGGFHRSRFSITSFTTGSAEKAF